jgi:outer membrane protein assembly factor BamB
MTITEQGAQTPAEQKQGITYTYLAVGVTDTTLHTLNPYSGLVAKVENTTPYRAGYDALALRVKDGRLYAMKQRSDTMLVIEAETGKVLEEKPLTGMPSRDGMGYVNGDFEPDGDTYIIASGPQQPAVRVNVTSNPPRVTQLNPAGSGGWYDWAYHPKDGQLYAVDGNDGSLIRIDQNANPLKKVLAAGCFPKAESAKQGERGLYSAVFFDTAGHLYAVDTAGYVNKLDLTASTKAKPVTSDDLKQAKSERVGGGRLRLDNLQVQDSAGQVLHQEIKEQYDWIKAEIKPRSDHPTETWEPARGWEYSYRLTLTAGKTDVRQWRATFDLPAYARLKTWGMEIKHHDGRQAYLHSQQDRLIHAGQSQDFDFMLWVPLDRKLPSMELKHLQAVRLG